MRLQLRLIHKGIILVSVPLIFELIFVGVLLNMYLQTEAEAQRTLHAKKVSDSITQLVKDIITTFRQVDGDALKHPGFDTNEIRRQLAHINDEIDDLHKLVANDPRQRQIFEEAAASVHDIEDVILHVGDVYDHGTAQDVSNVMRSTRKELQKRLKILGSSELLSMAQEQKELGERAPEVDAQFRRQLKILISIAIALNVMLALLLAAFFSNGISKRVKVLIDNSLRLAQGRPLHHVMKGTDEIAHLDQVFHNMADALAEAERSKQEMIGMVTHDLKTPLTTVSALLEMLEEGVFGKLNADGVKNLQVVSRNVARMNGLIRDLLDIEKIKSGKLSLIQEDINVPDLLEEAADSIRGIASERGISIAVDSEEVDVLGDHQRLQQILINLLSNAIKFSPNDSEIKLAAKRDGTLVHFTVEDKGRGIPANMVEAIFERFEQTRATDATVKGGTGLGLAICKALVALHGGQIGVMSEEGRGSTFFFTIPAATDESEVVQPMETTTHA